MSAAQEGKGREPAPVRIVETAGICGGYPRIWNARISVGLIVEAYREVGASLERTAKAFPQLAPEQICAALACFESYRERADADIASNVRALERLQDR